MVVDILRRNDGDRIPKTRNALQYVKRDHADQID